MCIHVPAHLQNVIRIEVRTEIETVAVTETVNVNVSVNVIMIEIDTMTEVTTLDIVTFVGQNLIIHPNQEIKIEPERHHRLRRGELLTRHRQARHPHRIVHTEQRVKQNRPNAIDCYRNGEATSARLPTRSPRNSSSWSKAKRKIAGFVRRPQNCITNGMHRTRWKVRPDWMHYAIYSKRSSLREANELEPNNLAPTMNRRNENIEFAVINVIHLAFDVSV